MDSRTSGCHALALAMLLSSALAPVEARAQIMRLDSAPFRSPQVALDPGPLTGAFTGWGEPIAPAHDQRVAELLASGVPQNTTLTVQFELGLHRTGVAVSLYNGHDTAPTPTLLFPDTATTNWFATCQFRNGPVRVVVQYFDEFAVFKGSRTTIGVDRNGFGLSTSGPDGTFYSQDARNPGASPHMLAFAGTGLNLGSAWLAFETSAAVTPAADFADVVLFVEGLGGAITTVHRTSWGALKSRFR